VTLEQPDLSEPVPRPWSVPLVVGSVLCGLGAFATTIVLSGLLLPTSSGSVEIGAGLLVFSILFVLLLVGCLLLGYLAARRR
jgi:MFS family permease